MADPTTPRQLFEDLTRDDDVGLVLRGHLHLEHMLIELLATGMVQPESCNWNRIPYAAKVELAAGHGLREDLKGLLVQIGRLRNSFAHTLSASLERQRVLDIYNSMSEWLRDGLCRGYDAMRQPGAPTPTELSPHDLLVVIILSAHSALRAQVATRNGV